MRALVALALAVGFASPALAQQKTQSQIQTEINTNVPDNTFGYVSPRGMRSILTDLLNNQFLPIGISPGTLLYNNAGYVGGYSLGAGLALGSTAGNANTPITSIAGLGSNVALALGQPVNSLVDTASLVAAADGVLPAGLTGYAAANLSGLGSGVAAALGGAIVGSGNLVAASGNVLPSGLTLPGATSIALGSDGNLLNQGPTAPTAGASMALNWIWGTSGNQTSLIDEASIWSAKVYVGEGFVSQFTSANNSTSANTGPNATHFDLALQNGSNNDVVASISDCLVKITGGFTCFGGNDIARTEASVSAKLVGREIDLEWANGATDAGGSIGIPINVYSIASSATAIQLGGVGGGTFLNGFMCSAVRGTCVGSASGESGTSFIDTTQGTFNQAINLGQGAGQGVSFGGLGFDTSPFVYGDSGGNLLIEEGASSLTRISGANTTYQLALCSTNASFAGCSYLGGNSVAPFQVLNPVNLNQALVNVTNAGVMNSLDGFSSGGAAGVTKTCGGTIVVTGGIITSC